jgi:hypothetical protein
MEGTNRSGSSTSFPGRPTGEAEDRRNGDPDALKAAGGEYAILAENVAETSEKLMEKFSAEGIYGGELMEGVRAGVLSCRSRRGYADPPLPVRPDALLKGSWITFLAPWGMARKGTDASGNEVEVTPDETARHAPLCLNPCPTSREIFLFRCIRKVAADITSSTRAPAAEKWGISMWPKGKKNSEVSEVGCATSSGIKLSDTKTAYPLVQGSVVWLTGIVFRSHAIRWRSFPRPRSGR